MGCGSCSHSFFEFSQTFMGVPITRYSSPLSFLRFLLVQIDRVTRQCSSAETKGARRVLFHRISSRIHCRIVAQIHLLFQLTVRDRGVMRLQKSYPILMTNAAYSNDCGLSLVGAAQGINGIVAFGDDHLSRQDLNRCVTRSHVYSSITQSELNQQQIDSCDNCVILTGNTIKQDSSALCAERQYQPIVPVRGNYPDGA